MALISAKTILTSLALFHLTLAFFFFTNPQTISDQALVFVLGESMGFAPTDAFTNPSPVLSFLSVVLTMMGLSDLLTLSMPDEVWLVHYWGAQAPLRSGIFAVLTAYTYLTNPSVPADPTKRWGHMAPPGRRAPGSGAGAIPAALGGGINTSPAVHAMGGTEALRNRVFFAFAFIEFLSWFWVWVTVKEEVQRFAFRKQQRRRSSAASGSVGKFQ